MKVVAVCSILKEAIVESFILSRMFPACDGKRIR
jgi:hypothetical protein